MENVIVIRYGEIYLKGKNREFFERQLIKNIRHKLKAYTCKLNIGRSRYLVTDYPAQQEEEIVAALKTTFGIHSLSVAVCVSNDYDTLSRTACNLGPKSGTFRVNVHRGDKRYPLTSVAVSAKLGADILVHNPDLQVDLHTPQHTVWVDIRENGTAYIYSKVIAGAGGMPVGCAGKGDRKSVV